MKKVNRIIIIRTILSILLVIMFLVTFGFSSQDSNKSSNISKKTTEMLVKNNKKVQSLDEKERIQVIGELETVIRKIAHFSLYTVIGILLILLNLTFDINLKRKIIQSILIGIIYAIIDEFHQMFSPGRSAEFRDVLIDTSGVLCGIVLGIVLTKIGSKILGKTIKKQTSNRKCIGEHENE